MDPSNPPLPPNPVPVNKSNSMFIFVIFIAVVAVFIAVGEAYLIGLQQNIKPQVFPTPSPIRQMSSFDKNIMKEKLKVVLSQTPFPSATLGPTIIPSIGGLYPYYYADDAGVWRRNNDISKPILVYAGVKSSEKGTWKYMFKVIEPNLILAVYTNNEYDTGDPGLYECNFDDKLLKSICIFKDTLHVFGGMLISKVPGETSYIYLKKAPPPQSLLGVVYAQVPYPIDVIKRNYVTNTSESIAQIEQQVGCGGGSWHGLYYHGYHRKILITSNKLILLQLGCEGYPGEGSQYVIDINNKKIVSGNWDFIDPKEIEGNKIVFHRIPKLWNHENLPESHVFYSAPLNDLTKETLLFDFGQDKYVSDMVYEKSQKKIFVSYIYAPKQYVDNANDYDLRIAQFDPYLTSVEPKDNLKTKGYYIDKLVATESMIIYRYSIYEEKENRYNSIANTYFFNPQTSSSSIQATMEIVPMNVSK